MVRVRATRLWAWDIRWGVFTCPLTAKFVFNVVSLSGEEFNKLILVFLHNALTLPTKKTEN